MQGLSSMLWLQFIHQHAVSLILRKQNAPHLSFICFRLFSGWCAHTFEVRWKVSPQVRAKFLHSWSRAKIIQNQLRFDRTHIRNKLPHFNGAPCIKHQCYTTACKHCTTLNYNTLTPWCTTQAVAVTRQHNWRLTYDRVDYKLTLISTKSFVLVGELQTLI